jgi:hypothetical protein
MDLSELYPDYIIRAIAVKFILARLGYDIIRRGDYQGEIPDIFPIVQYAPERLYLRQDDLLLK